MTRHYCTTEIKNSKHEQFKFVFFILRQFADYTCRRAPPRVSSESRQRIDRASSPTISFLNKCVIVHWRPPEHTCTLEFSLPLPQKKNHFEIIRVASQIANDNLSGTSEDFYNTSRVPAFMSTTLVRYRFFCLIIARRRILMYFQTFSSITYSVCVQYTIQSLLRPSRMDSIHMTIIHFSET